MIQYFINIDIYHYNRNLTVIWLNNCSHTSFANMRSCRSLEREPMELYGKPLTNIINKQLQSRKSLMLFKMLPMHNEPSDKSCSFKNLTITPTLLDYNNSSEPKIIKIYIWCLISWKQISMQSSRPISSMISTRNMSSISNTTFIQGSQGIEVHAHW